MTRPSVCDGYGIAAHHAGGLIEVRAPIPMRLCAECWRRWSRVHEHPGRHHR